MQEGNKDQVFELCDGLHYYGNKVLGKGGFGFVVKGSKRMEDGTTCEVAIKFNNLKEQNGQRRQLQNQRLSDEYHLMRQVKHPNVVKAFQYGVHEKWGHYIVMELMKGTLKDHMKEAGLTCLDEESAKYILYDVCLALKALHDIGLLHRDLKLENLLIDISNTVKVNDFGCSKILLREQDTADSMIGTFEFMPPEAFAGQKYGKGFDIYSLGIILYYLIVGRYPLGVAEMLRANTKGNLKISIEEFKQIHSKLEFPEELSKEVKELIRGMMAFEHDKRLTIQEVLSNPWFLSRAPNKNSSSMIQGSMMSSSFTTPKNCFYLLGRKGEELYSGFINTQIGMRISLDITEKLNLLHKFRACFEYRPRVEENDPLRPMFRMMVYFQLKRLASFNLTIAGSLSQTNVNLVEFIRSPKVVGMYHEMVTMFDKSQFSSQILAMSISDILKELSKAQPVFILSQEEEKELHKLKSTFLYRMYRLELNIKLNFRYLKENIKEIAGTSTNQHILNIEALPMKIKNHFHAFISQTFTMDPSAYKDSEKDSANCAFLNNLIRVQISSLTLKK